MVKAKVKVKEPHPLQKPWYLRDSEWPGQGKGDKGSRHFFSSTRQERSLLFLQPKSEAGGGRIRFLVRQHWDLHPVSYVMHVRAGISHHRYHPCLLDCCQNDTCSVAAKAGMRVGHPRFFLSSITGTTQVPPLLLLFHHWYHPGASASSFLASLVPSRLAQSLLEQN